MQPYTVSALDQGRRTPVVKLIPPYQHETACFTSYPVINPRRIRALLSKVAISHPLAVLASKQETLRMTVQIDRTIGFVPALYAPHLPIAEFRTP